VALLIQVVDAGGQTFMTFKAGGESSQKAARRTSLAVEFAISLVPVQAHS
jgi:hypothetical protein